MQHFREVSKRVLPHRFIQWYRRKRTIRQHLESVGYQLTHIAKLGAEGSDGRAAPGGPGAGEGMLRDVLERVDLIITELDRRIEGIAGRQLELRGEVARLRAEVDELREEHLAGAPPPPLPAG